MALRRHLMVKLRDPLNGITVLVASCPDLVCKNTNEVQAPTKGLEAWLNGHALIQDALPELTDFGRELLITGYCQPCWDKMWAYLEEEED